MFYSAKIIILQCKFLYFMLFESFIQKIKIIFLLSIVFLLKI